MRYEEKERNASIYPNAMLVAMKKTTDVKLPSCRYDKTEGALS
jgi:hypothetical protein